MSIESCLDELIKIIKTNTIFEIIALIVIGIIFLLLVFRKDKSTIKYAVIALVLALSIYLYNTIPLIIDYNNKDIIIDTGYYYLQEGEGIFEGDYLVGGSMDVELENNGNMVLTNADSGYPSGKHYGKIGYGRHSKKILGFEELEKHNTEDSSIR